MLAVGESTNFLNEPNCQVPPVKPATMKDKEYKNCTDKAKVEINKIYLSFVEDNSPQVYQI
jgi:hypothetical protein